MKQYRCLGKFPHTTYSTARRHLRDIRRKRPGYKGEVYQCRECGMLHIGRHPKEIRRAQKRDAEKTTEE